MKAKKTQGNKESFTLRMRVDLLAKLRQASEDAGMSMTELMEKTLEDHLTPTAIKVSAARAAAVRESARAQRQPAQS